MFGRTPKLEAVKLDAAMLRLLDDMENDETNSEEYANRLKHLKELSKLRSEERPERVSSDTIATVAGNLLGILIIVAYEQKHVMTSKGLSFVRPK
jgi:hypothetical protein